MPQARRYAALILLSGLQISTVSASPASAVPAASPASTQSATAVTKPVIPRSGDRPMTAQQYIRQQHEMRQEVNKMQQQVEQIVAAHQTAMTQNQALQLANDNLSVQVKVLQSEHSAQMFLYGAATISIGGVIGLVLGSVMARRQRRW